MLPKWRPLSRPQQDWPSLDVFGPLSESSVKTPAKPLLAQLEQVLTSLNLTGQTWSVWHDPVPLSQLDHLIQYIALEFLMLPRCSNPILQSANLLRQQPWGLSQMCFFPVSWTCKFILCTCYFFQRDYSSITSLLFTIQVSVQRSLLQRGLSGECIESKPPILYQITPLWHI